MPRDWGLSVEDSGLEGAAGNRRGGTPGRTGRPGLGHRPCAPRTPGSSASPVEPGGSGSRGRARAARLVQKVGGVPGSGGSRGGSWLRSVGAARLSPAPARARWLRRPIGLFPWEAGDRVLTLAPPGSLSQLGAFERPQGFEGEREGLVLNGSVSGDPLPAPASGACETNTNVRVG